MLFVRYQAENISTKSQLLECGTSRSIFSYKEAQLKREAKTK